MCLARIIDLLKQVSSSTLVTVGTDVYSHAHTQVVLECVGLDLFEGEVAVEVYSLVVYISILPLRIFDIVAMVVGVDAASAANGRRF